MVGLYDDAELYDLVAPSDPLMERYYVDLVGGADRRVLELACGSGRFTVPLARSGALVTGGDLSSEMLERGCMIAAESKLTVDFIQLDMRDFDLGRQFDVVIIAANSLMHLLTTDDFARAFGSVLRHMAPEAVLAFDIFVPSARLLSLAPGARQLVGTFQHQRMGEVTVMETIQYDPITQVSQADWYWSTKNEPDFRITNLLLRQIYPQELSLLLIQNGLRLIHRYGGFQREPLVSDSWRQVCIAARAI